MQHVLVVDTERKPCNPVTPGEARVLLSKGKAAVLRRYPFTIVLKVRSSRPVLPIRLKVDPGSRETGIVLMSECNMRVLFSMLVAHRSLAIKLRLDSRRAIRRNRRNRKARYRAPRFLNRSRKTGWLPPSLQHRVDTVMTWVRRMVLLAPVAAVEQFSITHGCESVCKLEKKARRRISGALISNSVHWTLFGAIKATGLRTEPRGEGSGRLVSMSSEVLVVKATGHGSRRVTNVDRFGLPRGAARKGGPVLGLRTGDVVRAVLTRGKHPGVHVGRIAANAKGSFVVYSAVGRVETGRNNCVLLHRKDGYAYG